MSLYCLSFLEGEEKPPGVVQGAASASAPKGEVGQQQLKLKGGSAEKGLSRKEPDLLDPRGSLELVNHGSAHEGIHCDPGEKLSQGFMGQDWGCNPGPPWEPLCVQRKGFMSEDNVLP